MFASLYIITARTSGVSLPEGALLEFVVFGLVDHDAGRHLVGALGLAVVVDKLALRIDQVHDDGVIHLWEGGGGSVSEARLTYRQRQGITDNYLVTHAEIMLEFGINLS